jgi:hypothetical protein
MEFPSQVRHKEKEATVVNQSESEVRSQVVSEGARRRKSPKDPVGWFEDPSRGSWVGFGDGKVED